MRHWLRLLSLSVLGVQTLPGPATAQQVLSVAPSELTGTVCLNAYLDGERLTCGQVGTRPQDLGECVMDMSFQVDALGRVKGYAGAFAGRGSTLIIVPYDGCEPHVGNFQGALLYGPGDLSTQTPTWLVGAPFTDCVLHPGGQPEGGDALLCASGGGNQGYFYSSVMAYWLDLSAAEPRVESGDVAYAAAEDNSGALGAQVIDCSGDSVEDIYFTLGSLQPLSPTRVAVEVRYLPAGSVGAVCAERWTPVETFMPKGPQEAYVNPMRIRQGTLLIDIDQGSVVLQ